MENKEKILLLEEERRELKEARLCKICVGSEMSVVFLPCGHLLTCAKCGGAFVRCPMCRSYVQAFVYARLA